MNALWNGSPSCRTASGDKKAAGGPRSSLCRPQDWNADGIVPRRQWAPTLESEALMSRHGPRMFSTVTHSLPLSAGPPVLARERLRNAIRRVLAGPDCSNMRPQKLCHPGYRRGCSRRANAPSNAHAMLNNAALLLPCRLSRDV